MVRATDAGVFAGTFAESEGDVVKLLNARWIWYWAGAATLSQLSQEGVGQPDQCKFPREVPHVVLLGVVQVMPVSQAAKASIDAVPVWQFED
jgi:hypothetical protein